MDKELPQSSHHVQGSIPLLILKIVGVIFAVETIYAFLLAFLLFSGSKTDYYGTIFSFLWIIQTAKFFFLLYVVLSIIIPWATTHYYISDRQLIRYRGFIQLDEKIYDLKTMRSVSLRESWLGKLLNYGDVIVVTAATGYNEEIKLVAITNPKTYERFLREYLTNAS